MDDVLSVHGQLRVIVGLIGVATAVGVAGATDNLLAGGIVGVLVVGVYVKGVVDRRKEDRE